MLHWSGLVRDLYSVNQDNQTVVHARLGLGGDVLKPYKATMDRWALARHVQRPGHLHR